MTTPAGLKAAQQMLGKVVKSPWFWIALAIVAALVLKNPIQQWWKRITADDRGNYEGHEGLNAADKARLEQLAANLRASIDSTFNSDRDDYINQAVAINDTELKYLAKYYLDINDGTSLWQDLDDEWTLDEAGERLISRLAGIAQL